MFKLHNLLFAAQLWLLPVGAYECICNDGVAYVIMAEPNPKIRNNLGVAYYRDCFFYDGTFFIGGEKFFKTHLKEKAGWFWMKENFDQPHLENCSNPIRDIDDGSAVVNCLYLFKTETLYREPKRTEENVIGELPICRNYIECPHLNSNETVERNNDTWFNVTYKHDKDKVSGYVLADRPMRWHCKQNTKKGVAVPTDTGGIKLEWLIVVGVISAVLLIALPVSMLIYHNRRVIDINWKDTNVKQDYEAKKTEFDVFISYSRDDYEWVKTLFLHLKSEGFAVCVDFKDFVPGEAVSENIMNAIYKSRKTIVVMSKNFLNSVWGQFEMQQSLCKSIAQRQDTLILIKFGKCKVPRKLMGKTFLDWTSVKEKQFFWQRLNKAIGREVFEP